MDSSSAFWAHSRAEERLAFEAVHGLRDQPAPRAPRRPRLPLRQLRRDGAEAAGQLHATREAEVDNLLRDGALVDLYKVVREGIRISEPSYSIKYVEHFYRPPREGDVQNAGASIVFYERWRETADPQLLPDIEAYNRDDVESTQQLRDWLLTLRPAGVAWKSHIPENAARCSPRRHDVQGPGSRAAAHSLPATAAWMPLPADESTWTVADRASELTYQLLDFHRRADKPAWWALYALQDMTEDELMEDPECLGGLQRSCGRQNGSRSRLAYTYLAPEQESKLATGDGCTRADTGQGLGTLTFDESSREVRLKVGPTKEPLPDRLSIGPAPPISSDSLVERPLPLRGQPAGGRRKVSRAQALPLARGAAAVGMAGGATDHRGRRRLA